MKKTKDHTLLEQKLLDALQRIEFWASGSGWCKESEGRDMCRDIAREALGMEAAPPQFATANHIKLIDEALTQRATLTTQRDMLVKALEKIDGFTMSQFVKVEDMLAACKLVASNALSQTKEGGA